MKKFFFTILALVLLGSSVGFSQWTYNGAFPDTNYKGGTHGIAVSPDGNVWTSSYYSTDWVVSTGDTLKAAPIIVFKADGTLVDTIYTVTQADGVDSLTGSCRGLSSGPDGNIYYVQSGPSKVIKINYQTMAGMGSHLCSETGSSPTKAAIAGDGTVFIGPVVGGGTSAIAMYDQDLNYIGNAVDGPPAISRTMEVSADGNTIYWTPFTALQMYIYQRADEFSAYELVDSALAGMSIETATWQPKTNYLWVSNDARGAAYTELTWYAYDPATKTLVDSLHLDNPIPGSSADVYPRGTAFSPDGKIAYVGLFGAAYNRIYKFTSSATDVEQEGTGIVKDYSLSQNYPNPFNPTTQISYNVAKAGFVTLKVYDLLGREVATLVNGEKANGNYHVNFDATNLASGTYIYQLQVNGVMMSKKMILMK